MCIRDSGRCSPGEIRFDLFITYLRIKYNPVSNTTETGSWQCHFHSGLALSSYIWFEGMGCFLAWIVYPILFSAGTAQKSKKCLCNLFTVLLRFRFFVYQIEILLQNPVVLLAFYFFRAILKTGNEVLPRLFAETAL